MVVLFLIFFKNSFFHINYTNLHSKKQDTGIPLSLHHWQHLLFLIFSIISILTGIRCSLIVVLICSSLMISNVEYLYMYLLAISTLSLERCLNHILYPFLHQYFLWFCLFVLLLNEFFKTHFGY